ncbi:MAG TPA: LuxR C-terminal-related transcriptional regulator [Phototrophicaceae bacterium]|nr:LuxR C-terminal-related transcriptional regulator [Phototrophicaceae bacterium]
MNDLALMPTTFIGRFEEIHEIGALLDDPACRLLTLVGPGGMGKTRLALEVAARKHASFPGGVFWTALAPLTQADDILGAVAEVMPFRFQKDERDPREQFFEYLRERRSKCMLLVLDNFEHLLDGASVVAEMLAATPMLKILVTSREVLNLQEEWVRQIAGMSYPTSDADQPLEAYSAVQLFLDRARRIRGNFDLHEDSRSVVDICRLVEGMPLAIELAAGWLKTLSPAAVVAEIRRSSDILTTRSRNLPERHRSIRAVFNHSWRLMSPDEQEVFQKLSVFRGGFTREAAQVVAGASLDTLAGLVDQSLVRSQAAGRYDIHEMLRQYGAEQLEAADQTAAVERAYVDYYLGTLRRLEPGIKAYRQMTSLDQIAADFENVRNAWLLALQQEHYTALSGAVESLQLFGDMRGHYHEVVALLRAAVEPAARGAEALYIQSRIRARLIRLIMLGNMRIDVDVRSQIDTCLMAARAHGDQSEIGFSLLVSGIVACWEWFAQHPYDSPFIAPYFRECYAVYQALGDPFYEAEALVWIASTTNDMQESNADLESSLKLRREINDLNGIAWITLNLTDVMLDQLNYGECERYAREALALMREIGSLKGVLQSMFQLARVIMLKGEFEEALALAEQMRDLAEQSHNLDGKRLSAGLRAFLVSVMDERYGEGAALARENQAILLEPLFGGYNDMGLRFGMAVAQCGLGQYETVRQSFSTFRWEHADDPGPATICLALEAVARAHESNFASAAELLGLAFEQPIRASGWLSRWPLITRLRAQLEDQLGAEAYRAAWERGCELDLVSTVTAILGASAPVPQLASSTALIDPLSEREIEILRLAASGLSNQQIADRLVLALGTVKSHLHNIYGKLGIEGRVQAIARARELHLV